MSDTNDKPAESPIANHAGRLESLEAKIEALAAAGASTVHEGGGLLQELVDFLHWVFPAGTAGKPVPGAPSAPEPPQA